MPIKISNNTQKKFHNIKWEQIWSILFINKLVSFIWRRQMVCAMCMCAGKYRDVILPMFVFVV